MVISSEPLVGQPARYTFPSPGFDHYWTQGNGRHLIQRLGYVPSEQLAQERIPWLFLYDQKADTVIETLYREQGLPKALETIGKVLQAGEAGLQHAPPVLTELLEEMKTAAAAFEDSLLETGAAFCRRTGVAALIVLRNYCLMGGYESAAINKPLIYTGALKKGPAKRMAETTQFWIDVTQEQGVRPFAPGFCAAVQVRFLHALSRVSILHRTDWNPQQWGMPLNQWDMTATNLGFSLVFLEGVRKMGYRPLPVEIKGLFHLWKCIGVLLGIPAACLPDTEEEAIAHLYAWTMTQPAGDADTKALARALMYEPLQVKYLKYGWQRKLLMRLNLGYNHYFLGNYACRALGLSPTLFVHHPRLLAFFNRLFENDAVPGSAAYQKKVHKGRKEQEKINRLAAMNT